MPKKTKGKVPSGTLSGVVATLFPFRDKVAPLVQQGKTLEEVVASKPTATYDSRVPMPGTTGVRFVGQLYAELKK